MYFLYQENQHLNAEIMQLRKAEQQSEGAVIKMVHYLCYLHIAVMQHFYSIQ